ncbi:Mov34/MPN/PAD-1 family protein [Sphingobium nicotianae]|uniref:Mov34/MPN/PAD-1 family protein n=1 Tax=Sphingobium nicotianae TaxID=2782607 RepID=A0A9X1DFA3_9SPHN|nr:Mov34/MPN/PAD-1 family protein [Sphingobium nicotianae]
MTTWLSRDVADAIQLLATTYYPVETGGVLLGWRDGEDRIVTGLTGPGPRALHGRHTFLPDHRWQVAQIEQAFAASSGDLDYLGDWHTHPDGIASMSEMDRKTLARIERRVRSPLMLIAAGAAESWAINSWIGRRSGFLSRLPPRIEPTRLFELSMGWPFYIATHDLDAAELGEP